MIRFTLLALLLCASSASAQTHWGLTWRAPEGCLQAADLSRLVEDRLGRSVFTLQPQVRVDGVVTASPSGGWRARLVLVDEAGRVLGSREVTTPKPDCRALDESLALVVAVMIDSAAALAAPAEVVREAPVEAAPLPERDTQEGAGQPPPRLMELPDDDVPAATPVAPPWPVPVERAPRRWPSEAVIGLTGHFGVLPWFQPLPGLIIAGQMDAGPLRFDLRLPVWPWAPVSVGDTSGWVSGVGLGAQLGWLWRPSVASSWATTLGAGLEAHGFVASTSGDVDRSIRWLGRAEVVARARVGWLPRGRGGVGLQVGVEGAWAPFHSTLRLESPLGVPRDAPLGPWRAGLEVALVLPGS